MNNITIGYLSWKRHKIFNQTLKSHLENGLFDIIKPENRIIFFQEISEKDKEIAKNYKCIYIGNKENIGIKAGFEKLVNNCSTKYFIFCENDWFLIENYTTTKHILEDSVSLLNEGVDIVKLRSRRNPGIPMFSKPKDVEEWKKQDCSRFPYKLESLNWIEDPESFYGNCIKKWAGNFEWFITDEKNQRWSNNIFICKTEFLKNNVLPVIDKFDNLHKYTGLEKLLIELNRIGFKISTGEGLFTHKDKLV